MRKRTIEVERRSVNAISPDALITQLESAAQKAIGKTFRGFKWTSATPTITHTADTNGTNYKAEVTFSKRQERERDNSQEVFDKQFTEIAARFVRFLRSSYWQPCEKQQSFKTQAALAIAEPKQEIKVAIPDDIAPHFAHIFDRDAQIRIVHRAIEAAKASGFRKRNHCILFGKPACGKTEILLAFERMLGVESVTKLDATMMTKAGAENLLLEMDNVPPILIIEELEKCNPANLPWLLGVMDNRGELIKTNARIGSVRKEARCLVLATVNDMALFQTVMSGALASRFQHKVYCPRPSKEVLQKILVREIKDINGNVQWIQPVLDYCLNVEQTDDPRRVIAVLDGGDKLLTGEYQRDLQAIRDAMEADGMTA